MKLYARVVAVAVSLSVFGGSAFTLSAQAPAQAPPAAAVKAGPPTGVRLAITAGSRVRYRVREQLAGISFPSDAVGATEAATGTLVFRPDGSIDATQSKLTVDLRTLKSDQEMRDGFVQRRTLETEKFPFAEFVARRTQGLPYPFPTTAPAQAGFQLVGDMTMHGVTTEVTWNVVATFTETGVAGLATTSFQFPAFGYTKPVLARLLSVGDDIQLELEFKALKTAL